ncbi:hypothetical protein PF005_g24915 [Phytophthora fragariae]|uniref:Secreted protein n=1 Tax=Phytophthora fragariae TaxID=53985 RepID=A0A6A3WMW3_9STRA|nr:hypothetical protein PF009_g25280 [Phytophthora fragariae]KAE8978320.1 hypothetical protein PF011_g23288 [Phytophthora fragariae]KAE9075945.1 hypothetical protein PF010_g24100 [Phytophthora fragariae]KAE9077768.1 hypothetical protein PF007_g24125 [Phytophthora fragariae]KAE9096487.1 hypothetical protein PF006_g23769 [Phytophthora fragariae]
MIIRRFVSIFTSMLSVLPCLHTDRSPNMVPAAPVILGMISVCRCRSWSASGTIDESRQVPRLVLCLRGHRTCVS